MNMLMNSYIFIFVYLPMIVVAYFLCNKIHFITFSRRIVQYGGRI